ncbi:MAG: hypothetical protein L6R28_04650 [Planctomycetes bacterium]|nr:hypothetical protein [Planctomycetota bacterium]
MEATDCGPNTRDATTAAVGVKRARFAELPKPRHAWAVEWGSRLAGLRTVKALRKVFGWRVRFSLRSLLLAVAGLSAGIGARVRFDENPWQQTWRWTVPKACEPSVSCFLNRAALSNDGRRAAVYLFGTEKMLGLDTYATVLLFDTTDPEAEPKPVGPYYPVGDAVFFFDERGRLLAENGLRLLDAERGEELLSWSSYWQLEGVSEDGRTAVTSEDSKAPYRVWDLDTKTLRCELPEGNYWLDGPRCTPAGTRGVSVRGGPGRKIELFDHGMKIIPDEYLDTYGAKSDYPFHWLLNENYAPYDMSAVDAEVKAKLNEYPMGDLPMEFTTLGSRVDVWDLVTGQVLDTFAHDVPVYGATLSRDGQWLLAGGDGWVTLWDVPAHLEKKTFRIDERFLGGEVSDEGWRVLFKTVDVGHNTYCEIIGNEQCLVRETAGGQRFYLAQQDELLHSGLVSSDTRPRNRFLSGGSRLVSWRSDGRADLLDAYTGKLVTCLESPFAYHSYVYGPTAVARDRDAVLFQDGKGLIKFERVRPEGPERILWLPEFWLAAFFALLLPFSLWRDGRLSPQRTQSNS